ncbi:MAG: AAA family ATPase [Deltaproteobacteria bacterium]|jgi:hypothetical protein|nr:AAA family ATPase [Deltaproteobacteria bacterium]
MKRLPVTDTPFSEIIEGGFLYADKTRYVYEMIHKYKFCFLSRPSRFGKTILLDAIAELFRGKKELFEGLWIASDNFPIESERGSPLTRGERKAYDFKIHPVVKISMAYGKIENAGQLQRKIIQDLALAAKSEGLALIEEDFDEAQSSLFEGLIEKYNGAKVVILVNDYDASASENLDSVAFARGNVDVLCDFYLALKKNTRYIRFAFVTGVTFFAKTAMGVESANMFKDISIKEEYAGVCGFTANDFDALFADRMESTLEILKNERRMKADATVKDLRNEIFETFGGYSWLGQDRILNPYSISRFFADKSFDSHWAKVGWTKNSRALIAKKPLDFIDPLQVGYTIEDLTKADVGHVNPTALLFHCGYLTIERVEFVEIAGVKGCPIYRGLMFLGAPNKEAKESFSAFCRESIFGLFYKELPELGCQLADAFGDKNAEALDALIGVIFDNVTILLNIPFEYRRHAVLRTALRAAGIDVKSEKTGRIGNSNLTVALTGDKYVIIQIKCLADINEDNKDKIIDEALDGILRQIIKIDRSGSYGIKNPSAIIGLAIVFYGEYAVRTKFGKERNFQCPQISLENEIP